MFAEKEKIMRDRSLFLLYSATLLAVGTASIRHVVLEARQKRLDRQLIAAVQSNDTRAVTDLLDQGANANAHRDLTSTSFSFWQRLRYPFRRESLPILQGASALQIAVGVDAHNDMVSSPRDTMNKYPMQMGSGQTAQCIGRGENVGILIALLQHGAAFPTHEKYTMKAETSNFKNKAFSVIFQMTPTQRDANTPLWLPPCVNYLEQPATRQQYIAFRHAAKLDTK